MNKKDRKKKFLQSFFILIGFGIFYWTLIINDDKLISITDVMEKEEGLVTNDVKEIKLTEVSSEANRYILTGTDIDKMMVYLGTTYIKKSKREIHTIDSQNYHVILYTDEYTEYKLSKPFMMKQDSGKTYIQLFGEGVEKIITYETEDNDLYDLVLSYLK